MNKSFIQFYKVVSKLYKKIGTKAEKKFLTINLKINICLIRYDAFEFVGILLKRQNSSVFSK